MLSLVASAVGCSSTAKPNTNVVKTLVSIAVAPSTPSVAVGSTQQFVATGTYSDNSTKDLSSSATWSWAATSTATISATGLAMGVAVGSTVITATSDGKNGTATLTVTKLPSTTATLVSIAVTPANQTLAKDATQQFIATGTYDDGNTMDLSATATWASSSTDIATISATGLATGLAKGTTMISAASGSVSGNTTLTVSTPPVLVSIAVTATSMSIAKGTTVQLTATGTYDDGNTKDLSATATWTSATPATATVSPTGLVTGVLGGGSSIITAMSGGKSGTITIAVTGATLVSIAVMPGTTSIAAGTTQPFTATGTFMEGTVATTQDLTAMVTWASATAATATISTAGLATGKATGTSVITATSGTIMGTATLTVTPALLVSIDVTTTTPSIAKGQTAKFIATGKFGDTTTQDLTTQVTWASATAATATISNTAPTIGTATSVVKGTTVISAKLGTIMGTLTLTVTDAQLLSIAVTAQVLAVPTATPTIATNTKVQLIATGTYTDSTADITGLVTWAASGNTVTVSNAGDSKGIASAGNVATTSMITATLGPAATAIVGKLTLTVKALDLLSINVTPATHTIAAGTTLQYTATGFFSDSSQQDMTETAAWKSATGAVATISNVAGTKGLAKGVAPAMNMPGTSVITASVGAISNTATLTVSTAVLVSISIDPPAPTLALGTTVTFTATGLYTDQSKQNLTTAVVWSSSKEQFAKISNAGGTNGKVTLIAKGTTDITAVYTIMQGQTVSATTTLIVTDPTLKSIEVGPATAGLPTPLTIEKGTTLQFAAVGTYTDGSTQVLTNTVTWKSDKTGVATLSNVAGSIGLATATGVGAASITATSSVDSGAVVSNAATLNVNDGTLMSIAVTPAAPSIAFGTKIQLAAIGTFNDGAKQDITGDVDWAADSTTAAVDDAGLVTAGLAAGTVKITASETIGTVTVSGNTTLTVTPATLQAIAIKPQPTASIANGTTVQFTATGSFSDNSTQDLTDTATWNTSDKTVATVSNLAVSNGLATGAKQGNANISASVIIGGNTITSPTVALTVTAATLVSIAITPTPASVAKGDTLDLTATGTYTDGTTQLLTGGAVTWATMTMATASVSNQPGQRGRVTGAALGMVTITATSSAATGSKVGTIMVTVTAPIIKSIAVTPLAPAALVKGHTQQFAAMATLTDGTKQDISATATWVSAMTGVASISTTGLATGIIAGTSKITAASAGVTSPSVLLTVTN